jgi:hypothetical protein
MPGRVNEFHQQIKDRAGADLHTVVCTLRRLSLIVFPNNNKMEGNRDSIY